MKKFLMAAAAFCCMTMMFTMTSCTDKDDNPVINPDPEEDLADVTVIFYGHGGGNLDASIIGNVRQFYWADPASYKNVKVAVQYKFSSKDEIPHFATEEEKGDFLEDIEFLGEESIEGVDDHEQYIRWMDPEGNSTFRFVLDPTQTLKNQTAVSYLPDENCDITDPASLTSYINWAVSQCPAKSYVLILSDHGGGYAPNDELYKEPTTTRGLIYDAGNDSKHFSAKSLAQALRASGIHFSTIYYDACLMNNMEYQFELKDLCDYVIASTYTVPGVGGCYDILLDCLSGASDHLDYGLEKYIEYAAKNWNFDDDTFPMYNDITLASTAGFDNLGQVMREFVNRLCDTYQYGTDLQRQQIDNVTKNAVKVVNSNAYYDAAKYMSSMMRALPDIYDDAFYGELRDAFNNCIVGQYTSQYLLNHNYQVDFSVLLGANGHYTYAWWDNKENEDKTALIFTLTYLRYYEADGKAITYTVNDGVFTGNGEANYTLEYYNDFNWGGTLESTYGQTAFDRATGWSRWLRLNQQEPPLWSRHDFYFDLPNGDVSDDPTLARFLR